MVLDARELRLSILAAHTRGDARGSVDLERVPFDEVRGVATIFDENFQSSGAPPAR